MVLGTAQQGCEKEASRKNALLGTAASRIDQKVTLRLRSGRNIKRSGRVGRLVELTATSDGFATAAFLCHDKKDQIQIIGFCIENLEVESKHTGVFFFCLSSEPQTNLGKAFSSSCSTQINPASLRCTCEAHKRGEDVKQWVTSQLRGV